MTVRKAQPQDLQGVLKYDRHINTERLEKCICDGFVYVLYDKEIESIAGILRYSLFWQLYPFLDLVYIDEEYQKKGFGTTMLKYWECDMSSQGFTHVLTSTQSDETAYVFYEKSGYNKCGSFDVPEQSAKELIYIKKL